MDWYNILYGFSYVSMFSVLIPIAFFLFGKRSGSKILFALLLASLIADIGNKIYAQLGFRGYIILNIFFSTEFILISLIYASVLIQRKVVYFCLFSFLIIHFLYSLYSQSIHQFQGIIHFFGSLIIIGQAVNYYLERHHLEMCHLEMHYLEMYYFLPAENPSRLIINGWINAAILYYFSFNLFLFAGANYVFKNATPEIGLIFWTFHNLNNIIKNCLFATGIYFINDEITK